MGGLDKVPYRAIYGVPLELEAYGVWTLDFLQTRNGDTEVLVTE